MVNFAPHFFHKRSDLNFCRDLCSRRRLNYVVNAGVQGGARFGSDIAFLKESPRFVIPCPREWSLDKLELILV